MPSPTQDQARSLESNLRKLIGGEVRFDDGARALYSMDASNYRQVPVGVVIPRDVDDVVATISICREHAVPVLCRGGGTSLAGQCCNVAVVLDFSKYMSKIIELDPEHRIARVQPGVILDDLRRAAEKYNLTFGPDPASHSRCTIGGMIGNNSCGVHSVMSGKTDENIEEIEALTYEGLRMKVGPVAEAELETVISEGGRRSEIFAGLKAIRDQYASHIRRRFPNIPRRVSGYNLNFLLPENGFHVAGALIGSEGTCATTLEATCRLVESPPERVLLLIGCRDIYECADLVPEVLAHKPIGLEGMDYWLVECTRKKNLHPEGLALLPEGNGWLLAEFGAKSSAEAESQASHLALSLTRAGHAVSTRLITNRHDARKAWEVRESALGAVTYVPGEAPNWEGWEDSAVAPEKLGAYLRDLGKLAESYQYRCTMYGHFGDGCVHNRLSFDLQSTQGVKKFRSFMNDAADLVLSYGGSLSGEHGDGQARAELLPKMFGPELIEAFRKFKTLWDPDWKMNPGKVVLPNRMDENLRLGPSYNPWQPQTHFQFPEDNGSLPRATLRCVGVGKCRQHEGGVMCPSFRATREEAHSTRGRAHLLWEMMQGDVIRERWKDEYVKASLDLCLACKGCKSECPVGVDVATYKAEFLSHYYGGTRRPLRHYAFGQIDRWARLSACFPGLANLLTQFPGLRSMAKAAAGIPPRRCIPRLAEQSFGRWFRRNREPSAAKSNRRKVVLWPDTFNNYFRPQTAVAALEVLEAAGCHVDLPAGHVCCGRPLYDFGMLQRARNLLLRTFEVLRDPIAAGTPIIVLEPGCASVFRDELLNLFPDDERAQKLSSQVFLFSEFLEREVPGFVVPLVHRRALVHGHCHHKSIMKMHDEEALLRRMDLNYEMPAQGCCGMAGAFGFEEEKYEISLAIGEQELLPAVRGAPADSLIIANGFSCREQIEQCTGRQTLHLAEVVRMALAQRHGESSARA